YLCVLAPLLLHPFPTRRSSDLVTARCHAYRLLQFPPVPAGYLHLPGFGLRLLVALVYETSCFVKRQAVFIPFLYRDPLADRPSFPVTLCNFRKQFFTDAPVTLFPVYINDEHFRCIKRRHASSDYPCDHAVYLCNITVAAASDIPGHFIFCVPEGDYAPLERFGHRPVHRLAPAFAAYYGNSQRIGNLRPPDHQIILFLTHTVTPRK